MIVLLISSINYQLTSYATDTLVPSTKKEDTLIGAWYNFNAHGCSSMYITQESKKGRLTGDFANGQAGWCAKPEQWFPLTGHMIGDNALTFTVNWQNDSQDCQSYTVWDGEIKDGILYTNWVLTSTNGGKTYHGEDTFYRECKCRHCPTP